MEGERAHDDCERAHGDSERRHADSEQVHIDNEETSIQYRRMCKMEFARLNDGQTITWKKIDTLSDRFFVGLDGQPSFVSRLGGVELKVQLVLWIFGSIGTALIVSVVALFLGAGRGK